MRFNMLWEIRLNEIEGFSLVSLILGICMVLVGAGWDWIAGLQFLAHHEGCGWRQALWITLWGVYSFWAWCVMDQWSEK